MHESLLPIGKMAALNRISVSTLRLYDEKGLLKPCYWTLFRELSGEWAIPVCR